MMPVFFDTELEGVATFWRIYRKDGCTLGLTSHNRALYFDGILHRAAPGLAPSAIRKTIGFSDESADVRGALSHGSISSKDLSAGLFDDASIEIGAVNWETLERAVLYSGMIGEVTESSQEFSASLRSAKRSLERDLVPYTSPTCRAEFCGPGCGLSAARFSIEAQIDNIDLDNNSVAGPGLQASLYLGGRLTPLEGPQTGMTFAIVATDGNAMILDRPIKSGASPDMAVRLREGCDHTHATCHGRFGNAVNFRGEPFLPGNDLLTRYPKAK